MVGEEARRALQQRRPNGGFTKHVESVDGLALLASHFPAGASQPVDVYARRTTAEQVQATVKAVPGVAQVLPPVVAAVAAYRTLRTRALTWDQVALAGCGGGLVAGVGFALLASLSGGAAGPGRMRFVGPFSRDVLVHAVTACGVGALLGAAVVALLVWRANRLWAGDDHTGSSESSGD